MSGNADPEKVLSDSSSNEDVNVTKEVIADDAQNTALGQLPLPIAPAPRPVPLSRLDSELPKQKKKGHKSKDKDNGKDEDNDPFQHLPAHEKEILKRQLEIPAVKINYLSLYRFATRNDKIIIGISSLASIIGGALLPLMTVSLPWSSQLSDLSDSPRFFSAVSQARFRTFS